MAYVSFEVEKHFTKKTQSHYSRHISHRAFSGIIKSSSQWNYGSRIKKKWAYSAGKKLLIMEKWAAQIQYFDTGNGDHLAVYLQNCKGFYDLLMPNLN